MRRWRLLVGALLLAAAIVSAQAQEDAGAVAVRRARNFARSRVAANASASGVRALAAGTALREPSARPSALTGAAGLDAARVQQLQMMEEVKAAPMASALSAAWQPLGPVRVASLRYGMVTGRVTAIAVDPADATGNTVYIGTTGGGVWKSVNAAGAAANVSFVPLTDTLPVFSQNAGTSAIASLSIGAVAVQPGGTGVVLAGTGDPNDATDSYYGTGLLRSADNGLTWTLIQFSQDGASGTHRFIGEGFAGLAWSTLSPQMVVAAVSQSTEGTLTAASTQGASARGLYYSADAGATWQMATIQDGAQIVQAPYSNFANYEGNAVTSVVWNPVRQRFYAAVRYHGYYESSDAKTWTRLAAQPGSGLTAANCPTLTGQVGSAGCPVFRGALAVQPVTGDLFALTADTNNVDQGLWQDACGLSGSACASNTVQWGRQIVSAPLEGAGGVIAQADYNMTLAAVPVSPSGGVGSGDTLLFAGVGDLFRCSLGVGCTLRNTTNATTGCGASSMVAGAQHAIGVVGAPLGGVAPLLFFGNDGGLWRSRDGVNQQGTSCSAEDASHFDNLNGGIGSLAEVAGLAEHPTDAETLLVGLGANGSAATSAASGLGPWPQLSAAESATVAIDQGDPRNWYVQSGGGVAVVQCTKGTGCGALDFAGAAAIGLPQVSQDASLVDAPFLLDPRFSTNTIVGTCRVWRGPSSGGALWPGSNAISAALFGPRGGVCGTLNGYIRSLGAGGVASTAGASQNAGSTVLYAGLAGRLDGGNGAGGHLFTTTAANTAASTTVWTDRSGSPVVNDAQGVFNPGGFDLSSIAVDPHDATGLTVYATVMGFGVPPVYRSVDGGATWMTVGSNLPLAPANAVVVDPNDSNTVYVALDTGVYVTTQIATCSVPTINCWSLYGAGLPNAPVVGLAASAQVTVPNGNGSGALRAATYGRGVWQMPLLTAGGVQSAAMTLSPGSLSFAATALGSTSASQAITVMNTGAGPLVVSNVIVQGDFAESDTCTAAPVAAGASCTVSVNFTPLAGGNRGGTVYLYGNVAGGYVAASLNGVGNGVAQVMLAPASLSFNSVLVHTASAAQRVTVTNTGGSATALQPPGVTGEFALAGTTCGVTLAGNAACTVDVSFTPAASGTRTGVLSLAGNDGLHTVALRGIGTAGAVTFAPEALVFADTSVGSTNSLALTITNSGNAPLTISGVGVSGDFTVTSTCLGAAIAAGARCTAQVVFTPAATGARSGTLTVTSDAGNVAGTQSSVALSGSGQGAFAIVLTPKSLLFGQTLVGQTSAVQNITISNTGRISGALGAPAVSGDYLIAANTCGATLASQTGCTVSIAFRPVASGVRTGTFLMTDDAGTQTAVLSGTGTAAATDTLSPLSLTFAGQTVNTSSAGQVLTLTNAGDVALTLISAQVIQGDFTATNGCGASLAAHAACAITVKFVPKSVGALSGVLTVSDVQRSQTVALNGSGLAPPGVSLLPSAAVFGATGVGTASAPQRVTLTNNGGQALSVTSVAFDGDFGVVAGTSTCSQGGVLAIGASCGMQVAFAPTAAGARQGALTVASDAAAPQRILLSGTGVDFTFAVNGTATVTAKSGGNAVFPLLLTPVVAMTQGVSFACSGAPSNATCKVTPPSGDLTAPLVVTATVLTGTSAAAARPLGQLDWKLGWQLAPVGLALWLPFAVGRRGRLRGALLIAVVMLYGLSGCGSGRHIPEDGSGGSGGGSVVTPAGTYPITVSATSAGLTRSVVVTLVVQ